MKQPQLVSQKSGKTHTVLCIESSDITFHGTYDKVVENFSYILAAASRENITSAKINSLPPLSALFCLLSVFSPHCSGWQGKYRSFCSGT